MAYDPQRRHARQPVAPSDHAPVDALLGDGDEPDTPDTTPTPGAASDRPPKADTAPSSVPPASPAPVDSRVTRLVAIAGAVAVVVAVLLLRRRRRRRAAA